MEEIKSILIRNGFSFKKQLGQNFITDAGLLRSIVEGAKIDENSTVVEIGCGAGTLTRELSACARQVYAYEIDRALQPVLAETLSGCENVTVIFRDFLKADMAALEEEIPPYTVVANLPYYITTPLVMRLVEESKKAKSLVIMVQEEVARRFCAKEGTADYGAVTAGIALRGEAKIIMRVPRDMFYPRPNVDSAVVKIDFVENRIPVKDKAMYRQTVRCAFLNRRKTLENNLMSGFKLSRESAAELLRAADIDEKARGETLSPWQFALLSDLLTLRLAKLC